MEILKKQEALIEFYELKINDLKNDFVFINVLYNMKCHYNYEKLDYKQKYELMNFICNLYMKDETKTDLGAFSDISMNNYNKILDGTITKNDIYNLL